MNIILNAIAQHQLLGFRYGGFHRIVEPYLLGVYKTKVQLLCYQIGGESSSGKIPEWRRMNVEEITELQPLNGSFMGTRPTKGLSKSPFDRLLTPIMLPVERRPKTYYLVSAVDKKRAQPAAARDVYNSIWFKLARAHVEQKQSPWFILSTQHGLLAPEAPIEPYDKELKTLTESEQQAWAERVFAGLQPKLYPGDRVVLFAGAALRSLLSEKLTGAGCEIEAPLKGLRIGEQARWFKQHTTSATANLPFQIAG
jgi:hypothetical protein